MPIIPTTISKPRRWTSYVLSALPALLLLFSAGMKLANAPGLAEGFNHLGLPISLSVPLGILEATCAIVYLIPRTAVFGAILLTGYMGGAILTHLRVGDPFLVQALLPIMAWGGLYLREPALQTLLPLRSATPSTRTV